MPHPEAKAYPSTLAIRRLTAKVHLGVGDEERAIPQEVSVDVRFHMPALMSSATNDSGEYICYAPICEKIQDLCTAKPYRLIEYLAHEIHRLLRAEIPDEVRLTVMVLKAPALLPFVGNTSYSYTDLPPFSWVAPE